MRSPDSLEVRTNNRPALLLAGLGTLLAVALAAALLGLPMPALLRAAGLVLWGPLAFVAQAGWQAARSRLQVDEIGLRRLDDHGWDLPWAAVEEMRIESGLLGPRLVVQAAPGPWQPRPGLMGGKAGEFSVPGVAELPQRPATQSPVGEWFGSSVVGRRDEIKGSLALAAALAAVALVAIGVEPLLPTVAALFFGLLGVLGWGGTRTLAVLDDHGVRKIGRDHWRRDWPEICSGSVVLSTLLLGVAPLQVQDRQASTGIGDQLARLGDVLDAPRVQVAQRDRERVQEIVNRPRGWTAP